MTIAVVAVAVALAAEWRRWRSAGAASDISAIAVLPFRTQIGAIKTKTDKLPRPARPPPLPLARSAPWYDADDLITL